MTQTKWAKIIWVAIILFAASWYFFSDWINSHANLIILAFLLLIAIMLATFYVVHDRNVEITEAKAKSIEEKLDSILEKL
jgi:purine-cytosine permease-like protein